MTDATQVQGVSETPAAPSLKQTRAEKMASIIQAQAERENTEVQTHPEFDAYLKETGELQEAELDQDDLTGVDGNSEQEYTEGSGQDTNQAPDQNQPPADSFDWLTTDEQGNQVARLKVSGEERLVSGEEFKKLLQKAAFATQEMEKAVNTRKAAEEAARRVAEKEAMLRRAEESMRQPPKGAVDDAARLAQAKEVVSEVWEGDPEVAAKKLAEFVSRTQGPALDIDQAIEAKLTAKERARQEQERKRTLKQAFDKAAESYPEVFKDPDMTRRADAEFEILLANPPADKGEAELIVDAYRIVHERYVGGNNKPPSEPSRAVDKRNLRPIPQSRPAGTPQKREAPEIDNSPSAVIARMKAARQGRARF